MSDVLSIFRSKDPNGYAYLAYTIIKTLNLKLRYGLCSGPGFLRRFDIVLLGPYLTFEVGS